MAHKYRFPRTVVKIARDQLLQAFPGLGNNPDYWRMLMYLVNPLRDDNGRWYIGHDVVDLITGDPNTNAFDFLTAFKRDVLPNFDWAEHTSGTARTITTSGIDAYWCDYWRLSRQMMHHTKQDGSKFDRVYFDDGRKWSRSKKAEITKRNDDAMRQAASQAYTAIQAMILQYHADLPTNVYQAITNGNRLDAFDAVRGFDDPAERNRLYHQLDQLLEYPKPYYAIPSDKTDRLYPARGCVNLTSCKRELRQALTRGCIDADLWACHLAIVARGWQVTSLQGLLRELRQAGKKPWGWFADQLGLVMTPEIKSALKRAVYSLCYGSSTRNIITAFDADSGAPQGTGSRFLALPVMADILAARKRVMDANKITVVDTYSGWGIDDYAAINQSGADIRSLLSCQSQAVEQELIGEIYRYALAHPEQVTILVYSYDGVTLQIPSRRADRQDKILDNIRLTVERKARQLGIDTTLDFDIL